MNNELIDRPEQLADARQLIDAIHEQFNTDREAKFATLFEGTPS